MEYIWYLLKLSCKFSSQLLSIICDRYEGLATDVVLTEHTGETRVDHMESNELISKFCVIYILRKAVPCIMNSWKSGISEFLPGILQADMRNDVYETLTYHCKTFTCDNNVCNGGSRLTCKKKAFVFIDLYLAGQFFIRNSWKSNVC